MAVGELGYITAAVIAGSAAFIGVVVAKEQKTTEFRQDWINSQRLDLALMISLARSALHLGPAKRNAALCQYDEAEARVRLRDNPDKHEWKDVIADLKELRRALTDTPILIDVDGNVDSIVAGSQRLLKTEWMRIRSGESGFKYLRWIIPALAALLLIGLAYGKGFIVIAPLPL